MSILFRIQQTKDDFTSTDLKIATYIEENLDSISVTPSDILAIQSKTSLAAWNRFAKRLGFKGITELKLETVRTINDRQSNINEWLIQKSDTLPIIAKKQISMIGDALADTERILNETVLNTCVNHLKTSRHIYIFGVGGNVIICQDFLQKLIRIGYSVICHQDFHVMFLELNNCSKEDIFVAVSYSGETREVTKCAEIAKEKGAKIVALTGFHLDSPLSKLADYPLYIPKTENELRIGAIMSRNSMLYLTDLLYFGLILEDFNGMRNKIFETHLLAKDIKKK